MPTKVIKKDGRTEFFIRGKIVVSAIKTGANVEVARKIVFGIEKHPKEDVRANWIREIVLDDLELHTPDRPNC